MSKTRIYAVRDRHSGGTSLVRAASPASAIRHVAEDMLAASVATQDELVRLLTEGVVVETAGEEPADADVLPIERAAA